jgi:hypothetical protein
MLPCVFEDVLYSQIYKLNTAHTVARDGRSSLLRCCCSLQRQLLLLLLPPFRLLEAALPTFDVAACRDSRLLFAPLQRLLLLLLLTR